MSNIATDTALQADLQEVQSKWGWFVALGAGLLVAGGIAAGNLFIATLVSIVWIAAMMFVGGVMLLAQAFTTHRLGRRVLYVASGLLYAAAGAIAIYDPVLASISLSLVIGILLIAAGGMRIVSGVQEHGQEGWGWIVAGGILTLVAGAIVVAAWPEIGLWLLGAILSVDLIFQGWGFIAFGLALRRQAGK
ncbi:HdeD family acid-resistance protein [Pseudochelatococcus sp. B33]